MGFELDGEFKDGLSLRFMAVDLPRSSVGDTLTIYNFGVVLFELGDIEKDTVVLANAMNVAITTASFLATAIFL
jgi:hypothetical protein